MATRESHEGPSFEIKQVSVDSPTLSEVKALAKKNSATLGFLPDGAFDAYAQRGWIFAAVSGGHLLGYVVYRVSNLKAVLVHLCTDQRLRKRGISRELFSTVVNQTNELHGILANTRRDFPASTLWPRLGFRAIGEKLGRGVNPSLLTQWWYEHPHPTLFSSDTTSLSVQSPIDVAIDLNVFYDLMMPSDREGADESNALHGGWLVDEIQLCVTGELYNEIDRLPDPEARRMQRDLANEFKQISGTAEEFDKMSSVLSSILGRARSDRQSSDLRHLAHAAATGVEFFVTRDREILRHQEDIANIAGVTPLSPTDLLIEIDQIKNDASYQPARFRGSSLLVGKVERKQRAALEDVFVNTALGERKSDFRRRLSAVLQPRSSLETNVVSLTGDPIALFCLDWSKPNILEVPCLRLSPGRLARTLARQMITIAIESSISESCSITAVTDDWLEPHVEEALTEGGFIKAGAPWIKLNYSAMGTQDGVKEGIERLLALAQDSGFQLQTTQWPSFPTESPLPAVHTALIERHLRPLKLTNNTMDTLVIPVQPRWAQHLFDSNLAEQTLFGGRPDLVFNWENAYYRSSRSIGNVLHPFRILWYESQDRRFMGTGQIRAYSVATNVEVLPARDAYKHYKRLGTYDWQQVLEISRGDPYGNIMVIQFRDTELFKNPIDRNRFRAILETTDHKRPALQGPQRISEAAFASIYREGQS